MEKTTVLDGETQTFFSGVLAMAKNGQSSSIQFCSFLFFLFLSLRFIVTGILRHPPALPLSYLR